MIFNKDDLQSLKNSPQQITSCQGCYEVCNQKHTFQEKHTTISIKKIQSQFDNFMYSEDQKWGNLIMEMISKIEAIKQFLKKLQEKIYDQIIQQKMIYTLNIQDLNSNDKKKLIKAANHIIEGKYNNLNCDQVNQINSIMQKKKNKRPNIQDAFNKIQEHLSLSIQQCINKQFPSLNHKKNYKDFKQQFNYQKNKQRTEKQFQNIKFNKSQKNRQQIRQKQFKQQIIRSPNQNCELKKITFKCQNRNQYPILKINQIQLLKGSFNIVLKVLTIQKIFSVGKRQLIEFIGGDQTGQAVCVLNLSQLIKQNTVLSISKCRIYVFHGTKQIQNSDDSQIFLEDYQIKKIGDYNLSQRNTKQRRYQQKVERDQQGRGKNQQRGQKRGYQRGGRRMVRKYNQSKEKQQIKVNERRDRDRENRINKDRDQIFKFRDLRKYRNNEEQISQKNKRISNNVKNNRNKQDDNNQTSDTYSGQLNSHQHQRQFSQEKQVIFQKQYPINKYTKIDKIGPGDENLCILAQVVQIQLKNDNFICILGDSSAVIKASINKKYSQLQKGRVFQFLNFDSIVIEDKILLKINKDQGQIRVTNIRIPNINLDQNVSNIEWEEQSLEDQQEQPDNNSTFLVKKHIDSDQDYIDF